MQKILIAALCLSLFLAGCSGNGLGSSSNPDSSSASSQSAPEEVLDCGEYIDGNTGEVLIPRPSSNLPPPPRREKPPRFTSKKPRRKATPSGTP